ncbi:Yip1 family protein [Chitinimonas sp.]|uniref:Yip1 family protein n=1 Tax=Chitinimonas sp. TaxID=1934313 RepID=UPI0035B0DD57
MQLISALTEPNKLWSELKEKPNFLLPLLLITIGTAVAMLVYFQRVDVAWLQDQMVAQVDPAQRAAVREQVSVNLIKWSSAIGGPIGILIVFALMAGYYTLAAKIAGARQGYGAWFGFTCWTSVPGVLGMAVLVVGALTMNPQTAMESLQLTHIDPLLVHLATDNPWKKLAGGFDLLSFWSIGLGAIGWRNWTGAGWGQAVFVNALPTILIYGGWAAFILAKH